MNCNWASKVTKQTCLILRGQQNETWGPSGVSAGQRQGLSLTLQSLSHMESCEREDNILLHGRRKDISYSFNLRGRGICF